jgi:hypothetical protein
MSAELIAEDIAQEIIKANVQVQSLQVVDDPSYNSAADFLKMIKLKIKAIDEKRKALLDEVEIYDDLYRRKRAGETLGDASAVEFTTMQKKYGGRPSEKNKEFKPEPLERRHKLTPTQAKEISFNKYGVELDADLPSQAKVQTVKAKPSDGYGKRADGTNKGTGYFGELKMKDGSNQFATEMSIGMDINGKKMEIPTLVPTLTNEEKDWLLKGGNPLDRSKIAEQIVKKSVEHAKGRVAKGLSPFKSEGESKTTTKQQLLGLKK